MMTYSGIATSVPEFVGQRDAAAPTQDRNQGRPVLLGIGLLLLMVWLFAGIGSHKPVSDLAYHLELVGGIFMLLILVYPLRTHIRLLHSWGANKYWFAVQLGLGIAGPLLILAQSMFRVDSTNAAVASYTLLLVTASAVVGRFLHAKIHHGPLGRKLDLHQLQTRARADYAEVKSKLYFAPAVARRLRNFEGYALLEYRPLVDDAWRFVTLGAVRQWIYLKCERDLRKLLLLQARVRRWDRAKFRRRMRVARSLAANHLASAQQVAQFATYERLFSLWHLLHVPLVYLLILSSIAQVVAVHLY